MVTLSGAGQLSGRPIKNLRSASRHCKFAYLKDFRPSAMQICSYVKAAWWCVTPFLGAGIGTSRNTISSFVDIGATQAGANILSTTYAENASKWNLAWALYAGLAYKVTPGLWLELTYRYVNLGTAVTGPTNSFDGTTVVNATPFNFGTITSQNVMLGFRWNLGEPEPPVMAPPLIRKG
jgi:opacity protein-like surface antigen